MPPGKVRAASRATTLRKMTSSSLSEDDVANNASHVMTERAHNMSYRAKEGMPLTNDEIRDVINSLRNVTPVDHANNNVDWNALERLLAEVGHVSHKDWNVTGINSSRLGDIVLPPDHRGVGGGPMTTSHSARQMFERILHEGNWDGALAHATANSVDVSSGGGERRPWVVLVTGVNGIRKTTSIYQPWFANVLHESLVSPSSSSSSREKDEEERQFALEDMPTGENSFFRQLDHMIATLCNEDFSALYALTGAQLRNDDHDGTRNGGTMGKNDDHHLTPPPKDLIEKYSNLKGGIFSRYRTLSELLGVLLLREAQDANLNVMCETSGRDVAMFHYVDHFFPRGGGGRRRRYNKLALHFTINDLDHAMRSVDARMVDEMRMGHEAIKSGDVVEVIYANLGGPYGSGVLRGVREDSDRVWDEIIMKEDGGGGVGGDWYKSSMRINAHSGKPWTIQAVRPDGSFGEEYTFCDPRTV